MRKMTAATIIMLLLTVLLLCGCAGEKDEISTPETNQDSLTVEIDADKVFKIVVIHGNKPFTILRNDNRNLIDSAVDSINGKYVLNSVLGKTRPGDYDIVSFYDAGRNLIASFCIIRCKDGSTGICDNNFQNDRVYTNCDDRDGLDTLVLSVVDEITAFNPGADPDSLTVSINAEKIYEVFVSRRETDGPHSFRSFTVQRKYNGDLIDKVVNLLNGEYVFNSIVDENFSSRTDCIALRDADGSLTARYYIIGCKDGSTGIWDESAPKELVYTKDDGGESLEALVQCVLDDYEIFDPETDPDPLTVEIDADKVYGVEIYHNYQTFKVLREDNGELIDTAVRLINGEYAFNSVWYNDRSGSGNSIAFYDADGNLIAVYTVIRCEDGTSGIWNESLNNHFLYMKDDGGKGLKDLIQSVLDDAFAKGLTTVHYRIS